MTTNEQVKADRHVVDFDHHAREIAADPYPAYAKLRSGCPVAWTERHGGYWVLSDYESVFKAAQDDATFTSTPSTAIPPHPGGAKLIPIDTDAPYTQQYRKILLADFSPAASERRAPEVRDIADALLDKFAGAGACDLVSDYAIPIPATVAQRLLGLPGDWHWYVDRVHKMNDMANDPDGSQRAALELMDVVREQIEDRRANGFRDDQISMIMQGLVDGQPMPEQDILSFIVLMIIAGLDTTAGALANALIRLDREPVLRARLIAHPEDIPRAVEEFLRFDATVAAVARNLSRDIVLAGQQLRAGDRALLVFASANRDSGAFEQPDEIDIDRPRNRHLSFAAGLHRCLGSSLARVMLRVSLERLLARIPDFRLSEDPDHYRGEDAGVVFTVRSLPAVFTPVDAA